MDNDMDSDSGSDSQTANISKKDLAKKIRFEANLRAKEFKKTDPREIARKALAKELRKAAYQRAKERNKMFKKTSKEKLDLKDKIVLASDLEFDERPLAPIIPIDILKLRQNRLK